MVDAVAQAKYRNDLPNMKDDAKFITCAGFETTMVFDKKIDLPYFAAYTVMSREDGKDIVNWFYKQYLDIAENRKLPIILDSCTWRGTQGWADKIDKEKYTPENLAQINKDIIAILENLRAEYEPKTGKPVVINATFGGQADGYKPEEFMTPAQAKEYHMPMIKHIKENTSADMITGKTLTYVDEAIGFAQAANEVDMPVMISFTVETDGKLPGGVSLASAIEQVDKAAKVLYFSINCAHPLHFNKIFDEDTTGHLKRVRGLRVNASKKSHAELDESTELDAGNPEESAQLIKELVEKNTHLISLGGCCGTSVPHIDAIAANL